MSRDMGLFSAAAVLSLVVVREGSELIPRKEGVTFDSEFRMPSSFPQR
jgi:hypothetical protein